MSAASSSIHWSQRLIFVPRISKSASTVSPAFSTSRWKLPLRGRAKSPALVSESSAEGTRAISDQYERVRENAEEERQRAAEGMRAIYEQTAGETQTLFQTANERFAEAVQGMKQMAAEMQRELEVTRTELRRGVFELPQETAESAAQMRRVIVDQIEALAELNRIVARHGRNLDAVEPVRRVREEPALAVVGGRNEPPHAQRNWGAQRNNTAQRDHATQ